MISGRADCSGDWLPARIRPVRGESFDSLCRRLASANTLTLTQLLRACMSRHPDAQNPMVALALCIGVDSADLELLTLAGMRRRCTQRLATTVWLCRRCSAAGIEDALRSHYLQFLCLRCGSFLSRYRAPTTELQTSSWLATPTWPFKTNFWTRALSTTRSLIE